MQRAWKRAKANKGVTGMGGMDMAQTGRDRALNVGTIPFSQWNAIQNATCRLNPETRVTLERPASRDRMAYADGGAAVQAVKQAPSPAVPRPRSRNI